MTDRAGRWATEQVGRYARAVNEIAKELGCDWHTVNDVVIAYGEGINNLIKRVKRAAFGMTNFANFRIRALLYAGKPNWDLLATLRPR